MAISAPYLTGSKRESLDPQVFGQPFHEALVHEAVRAEGRALRRGTASTKGRGEVAMTGAKAFRQKGTGRARAGPLSTPQRVGGGIAFGPKPRRYTVKVNRKARRRALGAALSLHAERGSLAVVDPGGFAEPSTKRAADLIERSHAAPTLVVLAREGEEACARSFRNLAGVTVVAVDDVGVAEIVWARRLVLSPAAIARLSEAAGAAPAAGEEG